MVFTETKETQSNTRRTDNSNNRYGDYFSSLQKTINLQNFTDRPYNDYKTPNNTGQAGGNMGWGSNYTQTVSPFIR
jgi:hypothetical protein